MAEMESIFSKVVLSLQFCLAFWQVIKFTVLAAFIKALVSRCISMLPFSHHLSPYSRLGELFDDLFIFKFGQCLVTKEADEGSVAREVSHETSIKINYLGNHFHLERKDTYRLFVNGNMAYYITDLIWHSLLGLKIVNNGTLFIKGHKNLGFEGLYAGGVMDLSEVLDYLVLKNHIITSLSHGLGYDRLIPINLSVSEEKILKGLNILGLFLQTKKYGHWLIPLLLSFTSAMLEFCTPLRMLIYTTVNRIFCWAMHPLCDCLPQWRRFVTYSFFFGWVENMKPSNDFEWRVVSGVTTAVIGGGAKVCLQNAPLLHSPTQLETIPSSVEFSSRGEHPVLAKLSYHQRKVTISLDFDRVYSRIFKVDCEEDKYKHLRTFFECLVRNRSGSLETYEPKGRVCKVRSFKESILCYIKNGFPEVYELKLENAIVK